MTAVADLISRTTRQRVARRQAELRQLAALMRERAALAPAPVPVPLHKMGAARGERKRRP